VNTTDQVTVQQLRLKQAKEFLPAVTAEEIITEPYIEPEMLIERFLERQSLTMLDGAYGSSKTGFLFLLGLMVALGTNFSLPFGEVKQGKVLFVGVESNRKQYARQFKKIVQGFKITTVPDFEMVFVPQFDITDDAHFNHLYHRAQEFDLVLLDTLSAACGAKLSDNDEMRRPMARLYELATLTSTIFSHHYHKPTATSSRESKFNALGANAIGKTCDAQWGISMTDEGAITLVCEKDRGAGSFRKGDKVYMHMSYDKYMVTFRTSESPDTLCDRTIETKLIESGPEGVRAGVLKDLVATMFTLGESAAYDRVRASMSRLVGKYGSRLSRESDQKPWMLTFEEGMPNGGSLTA